MEKIWLKQYPKAVQETIDPEQYSSLMAMFDESVEKFGDRPAVTNLGVTLTYRELDQKARDFASYLQNELGLQKGDKLALMMPNLL